MPPDADRNLTPGPGPVDFRRVVADHWGAVYRLMETMTGNRHDAEDLAQETFLRALDRWESFRPGTNLRSWLLRIASNAFFDVRRKRRRVSIGPLPDDVPGRADPPDQAAEAAEQHALLRAAVGELSELTRLVFHLRTTEDLSFREIGGLAGVSEDAARWHMHQARAKLMARLAGTPRDPRAPGRTGTPAELS